MGYLRGVNTGLRARFPFPVDLPGGEASPLRKILGRLAIALGLITYVAIVTYIGRDGYIDPEDGTISLLDAFYYSTVSITTTGYGDIRPVSDTARWVTTVLVTPARVLFLILLVGTTLEILAERSRHAYRVARWRRKLNDHTIVCGSGVKGRSAVTTRSTSRRSARSGVTQSTPISGNRRLVSAARRSGASEFPRSPPKTS